MAFSGTPTLRSDACRNRERLIAAASAVFAELGLDVPLERIAREAGVSIGTLYNRFPTRDLLLDAVFLDRLGQVVALAEAACVNDDPWQGLVDYLTRMCEMQSADRGFNELAARGLAHSPQANELHRAARSHMSKLICRAQQTGVLRGDLTVEDLAFVVWGVSRTIELTIDTNPDVWRRHLALLLDGFRSNGAHPIGVDPLVPAPDHVTARETSPGPSTHRRTNDSKGAE